MMKKSVFFIVATLLLCACNGNANQENEKGLKRYKVKSGKITYQIRTNGKVMGSTVTGEGTVNCVFKDWGAVELRERKETTTTIVKIPFGGTQKDVQTSHTINKLVSDKSYSVDFEAKKIYEGSDLAMNLIKGLHPNKDAEKVGREGMEAIGGEKIGTEKILGYTCEVWQALGVKLWTYKGLTLKTEANIADVDVVEEAIDAKFNISVSDNDLKLPDFPIEKQPDFTGGDDFEDDMEEGNMQEDVMQEMKKMQDMSFEEWKKAVTENNSEMQQMSDKELRQVYDMMQNASKMMLK